MQEHFSLFMCPEPGCCEHNDTRIYCPKDNRLMVKIVVQVTLRETEPKSSEGKGPMPKFRRIFSRAR